MLKFTKYSLGFPEHKKLSEEGTNVLFFSSDDGTVRYGFMTEDCTYFSDNTPYPVITYDDPNNHSRNGASVGAECCHFMVVEVED